MTDRPNPRRSARATQRIAAIAIGLPLLGPLAFQTGPARAETINLTETGSTLLYPLFNVWVAEYTKTHPGVKISTAATGSGAGIDQALSGKVLIGTSDSFMSDADIRRHPEILNVPMAISALTVNYNLPGLNDTNLKLDGPTLAGIYAGRIRSWDDKAIATLNPGVTLPHHDIIPVRRADSSGHTFVFTQYLTFSAESWENKYGFGDTIAWPAVPGELQATGAEGVLEKIGQIPYSISYLGVSYHADIAKAGLGTAALKNYSGQFLLPTRQTIEAAASELTPRTPPDERLTLVNAPGANAYPLVNYEYAIVSKKQANPAVAEATRKFLLWAIAPDEMNDEFIKAEHFIPLPARIWVLSHDQIMMIASPHAAAAAETPDRAVAAVAGEETPAAETPAPDSAAAGEAPAAPMAEEPAPPAPAPSDEASAAPEAAPAPAESAKPPASEPEAPAVAAAPSTVIFPSAISPAYAKDKPSKARFKTCFDQYKANKATNANGGLQWTQKDGGGYWNECNKHLNQPG